ncbi:hypothetical protein COM21_00320 [Bacillus toyonensis]|uniref:DUF6270 domain-containing protein n=1 Tax=Bacillus toyonensis TaxID=155322 RepID=UPI000BF6AA95|nr:DUF6270 domain-containing protein [Bacillus toyonensis]PGC71250.1 hypothetical protein COM21_00320 [Bacillus toyonensis]
MKVITIGTGSQLLFDLYKKPDISLIGSVCKTNIMSLMSSPIKELHQQDTMGLNHYTLEQLKKDYFKRLTERAKESDYIIIDFLDETYSSVKRDGSFITLNYDVQSSSLMNTLKNNEVYKNELNETWYSTCLLLIARLKKLISNEKIILHEMYLAEKYKKDGKLLEFSNVEEIKKINKILKGKYEFFKGNFEGINVINIDQNYADANHKYLLRPHLLSTSYYECLYDILWNNFAMKQGKYRNENLIIKMLIFGSCDSRDIFRVYEEHNGHRKYEIIDYYARSSLASVAAKPISYKEDQISLSSTFRRKSLHRDLEKTFIKNLEDIAKKVDYLVIDFMEERFDILRYNNTHFTRSWEYRESNLQNEFNTTILDRFDSGVTKIWEENCSKFIEELKKHFRPEQIILNEVQMVNSYLKDNQMYLFENQDYICKFNKLLAHYHQYFKENFEGINVIKPKKEDYFYCDSKHLWGCFPYHFNDKYYLELERQIEELID